MTTTTTRGVVVPSLSLSSTQPRAAKSNDAKKHLETNDEKTRERRSINKKRRRTNNVKCRRVPERRQKVKKFVLGDIL
tara:strand:- start:47 stop:280 length:234 start_codon:yes stop_codon:yes gene_type:complete